ncbi:MAG: thioredoxin family protein [Planctomycetota bacterium]|nr:thioredoxin family protein [Planctomycetota bacterium]
MLKIQVLGPGCAKCDKLAQNAQQAADELGLDYTFEKVTDLQAILASGVVTPPALVVDGEVKVVGKAISPEQVKELLQ